MERCGISLIDLQYVATGFGLSSQQKTFMAGKTLPYRQSGLWMLTAITNFHHNIWVFSVTKAYEILNTILLEFTI